MANKMSTKILIYDRLNKEKEALEMYNEYRNIFDIDKVLNIHINHVKTKDNFYLSQTTEPDVVVFGIEPWGFDWYIVLKMNDDLKQYIIVKFYSMSNEKKYLNKSVQFLKQKGYDIKNLQAIIPLVGKQDFLYDSNLLINNHFKPEYIFYTYEIRDKPYSKGVMSKIKPFLSLIYDETGIVSKYKDILDLLINVNIFKIEKCHLFDDNINQIMKYFKLDKGEFGGLLKKNDGLFSLLSKEYGKYHFIKTIESNSLKDVSNKKYNYLEREYVYVYGKALLIKNIKTNINFFDKKIEFLKKSVEKTKENIKKIESDIEDHETELKRDTEQYQDRIIKGTDMFENKKVRKEVFDAFIEKYEKLLDEAKDIYEKKFNNSISLLKREKKSLNDIINEIELRKKNKILEEEKLKSIIMTPKEKEMLRKINKKLDILITMDESEIDKYNVSTDELEEYMDKDEQEDFETLLKNKNFDNYIQENICQLIFDFFEPYDVFHIHPGVCSSGREDFGLSSLSDKIITLKRALNNILKDKPLCADIVFLTDNKNPNIYYADIIQHNPYLDYIFRKNTYLKKFIYKLMNPFSEFIEHIFNNVISPFLISSNIKEDEFVLKKINWDFIRRINNRISSNQQNSIEQKQNSGYVEILLDEVETDIPELWNLIKYIPIFMYNFEIGYGKIPSYYVKYTYDPKTDVSVDNGSFDEDVIIKSLSLIQKHEETDIKKSYENFLLNLSNQ